MIQRWTICITLIFCAIAGAENTYYPFQPNVRYQYRIQASRTIGTEEKNFNSSAAIIRLQPESLAGKKVFPERYEIGGETTSYSFVSEDETGIYYVGSKGAHDAEAHISSPVQYLMRYPIRIGTGWIQPGSEFELLNDNRKLPVQLHADIAGTAENVVVPAGSFNGCLRVTIKGIAAGEGNDSHVQFQIQKDLWYAPGVGLIKSIQKEEKLASASTQSGSFSIVMLLENFGTAKTQN